MDSSELLQGLMVPPVITILQLRVSYRGPVYCLAKDYQLLRINMFKEVGLINMFNVCSVFTFIDFRSTQM
jgi:hypothetical protein